MGNFSDALEKAGVDLIDKRSEPAKEDSARKDRSGETKNVEKISPSEPWEERLDLIANDSAYASETFRVLRSRILFPVDGRSTPKTILVTSVAPSEGKSMVSTNLALSMARGVDQTALLIDCDLRRPSLAKNLGLGSVSKRGLADYLRHDASLEEVIIKTSIQKFSLIPSGPAPLNPAELLSSERMQDLIAEVRDRYDNRFAIFDSPPYHAAAEANVLAKAVDGVVIVVGYGKSHRQKVKTMVETIGQEKIYGIVFNAMRGNYLNRTIFDSSGYGYYSTYGSDSH